MFHLVVQSQWWSRFRRCSRARNRSNRRICWRSTEISPDHQVKHWTIQYIASNIHHLLNPPNASLADTQEHSPIPVPSQSICRSHHTSKRLYSSPFLSSSFTVLNKCEWETAAICCFISWENKYVENVLCTIASRKFSFSQDYFEKINEFDSHQEMLTVRSETCFQCREMRRSFTTL